jgi:putative transposase
MAQSLAIILVHVIFSTKNRKPFIRKQIAKDFYSYIAGIAASYDSEVHEIGGVENHIHLLISLPRTITLSKLIEETKKGSSRWIKTQGGDYTGFSWQNGYGAFSIGKSTLETVRAYIQNQEEHHKKISFEDEFRLFLKKYGVTFNEQYVWD